MEIVIKLPEKHGYLIDMDALIEKYKDSPVKIGQKQIETMPVILEGTK